MSKRSDDIWEMVAISALILVYVILPPVIIIIEALW